MPSKTLLIWVGVGLSIVAALVASLFTLNQKKKLRLEGSVAKVRTAALSGTRSVAVVDFRAVNPSKFRFVVDTIAVDAVLANGETVQGQFVSEGDAKQLFTALPELGEKRADSLVIRQNIGPGESTERMTAAAFSVPLADLDARKSLTVRIHDLDGAVARIQ